MSSNTVLRTLLDTDYRNTKSLMMERFHPNDVQCFVEAWKWRNWSASLCIERFGTILGFALVTGNHLDYLVVSQYHEGLGYGRILVQHVLEELYEQGHKAVTLTTADDPTLSSWYERQGFDVEAISWDDQGICGESMAFRFRVLRAAAALARYRIAEMCA